MGFVSPAGDYIERRLNPEDMLTTDLSRIVETATGYAVIEPVTKLSQGQVLLILCGGYTQFAKLQGRSLITDDGEAIEGEAMGEVGVLGRVTFFINRVLEDDRPTI
ncbi:hypothetical protein KQ929_08840 [Leclercia pneumoniae]|uniref:Uncharacterized protein n=1 Tax=Leclercia pneumoniae TaxID=2815358 RepID=A0ABX8K3L0_9ENTR|nr:hypothetical protein [Leclercia pneumoniae]QSW37538.1 hypothetical protein JZ655_11670 [Leclercia pneumoniae]QWW81721.1 hypothetical protein KQ929_08840 [Leclercia pneumoniae]